MSEDTQIHKDIREGFSLKVPDLEISSKEPWGDDALDREKVAIALTNLVQDQSQPLTVSLHGSWGTGKTFLLQRWQKDLEKNGFKSIYFNAWEDDFYNDPLVAIIGQLSEFLKSEKYKGINNKIKSAVKPLIRKSALNILRKATGLDLDEILEQFADKALDEYSLQNENKGKLKKCLQEMSGKVQEETKQPLIFIIDELDRCRPTFAIELLERVKHIFDIPGIVFVFGINHDQLCPAIKSVYGKIDADIYLRRFFDMSLLLPEANLNTFCRHLIKKYQLEEAFLNLDKKTNDDIYSREFQRFNKSFPVFYSYFGFSLRDADHCIRSLAFVGKSVNEGEQMHPILTGVLIFLRLKNQTLYRKFIKGECFGAEVMDYINQIFPSESIDNNLKHILNSIEVNLYAADNEFGRYSMGQFYKLLDAPDIPHPEYLCEKTRHLNMTIDSDNKRLQELRYAIAEITNNSPNLGYIASLIELTEIQTVRK